MELEYAFLADAAQVSDGKTFILGGGVTILWRQQFPAPLVALTSLASSNAATQREYASSSTWRRSPSEIMGYPLFPSIFRESG
jgi:hypothetical protein